jgi:hypothetical protein
VSFFDHKYIARLAADTAAFEAEIREAERKRITALLIARSGGPEVKLQCAMWLADVIAEINQSDATA